MSFRIVRAAVATERESALHEARLLLLLSGCSHRGDGAIEGFTKLAKLDFFLRYPVYFERLVKKLRRRPVIVPMQPHERDTVESKMIRFRYGPWDPRYRSWIGILSAKGLVAARPEGRASVHLTLTDQGRAVAATLAQSPEFFDLAVRANLVGQVAGQETGNRLKELVYETVPEIGSMTWGEQIEPS